MIIEQGQVFRQLSFSGEQFIYRDELVSIGTPAVEVLLEILRLHPEIEHASYTTFNPRDSSNTEDTQSQPSWIHRTQASDSHLTSLSNSFYPIEPDTTEEDYEDENTKKKAIAITSQVSLQNGQTMHIPLIDFAELNPDQLGEARVALSPEKGFLLKTDNSYHFWGLNLMSQEQWQSFIRRCLKQSETDRPIFDERFLDASLNRGFTALRIFGYPGTEKPTPPEVIGYI